MDQSYLADSDDIAPLPRPVTIRDHVYHLLRAQLGSGRFRFDERIVEKDLVEQLRVSRTPVRDALARLASEGFLVSTKHGYRVPTISLGDIDNMSEMRAVLEPLAARQAAENQSSVGFGIMRDAIGDERAAHERDIANDFERAHLDYRRAWLSRVRNPLLLEAVGKSLVTLQLLRHLALKVPEIRLHIIDSHQGLLDRLEARDPPGAADYQERRVAEFHELLVRHVAVELTDPA